MENYLKLVNSILKEGAYRNDRTGTGTIAIFGPNMEFDLRKGFPAVTTKELWFKGVVVELLWMIQGSESAKFMLENDVHIWDEWMTVDKMLGRVYGVQWRQWRKHRMKNLLDSELVDTIDQLEDVINQIKHTPHSRRILMNNWNVGELDQMALPPCPVLDQFYVDGDWIDAKWYQRSADVFLGLPFDIASKAILLSLVAKCTNKKPRMLYCSIGDAHIYKNHITQCEEQLRREPYVLPKLNILTDNTDINNFKLSDFELVGYNHHPAIKGDISK